MTAAKLCRPGKSPHIPTMLLARDKSQLLIVDVQEKLLQAISGKDRVVERCVRLVRAARTLDVPITVSEQYPQGLGPTVDSDPRRARQCGACRRQGRILLPQERVLARAAA